MNVLARILAHLSAALGYLRHGRAALADDDMLMDMLAACGAQHDDPDVAWAALLDHLA